MKATREGFGLALQQIGLNDPKIVALAADLTDSVKMNLFKESCPDRFFEVGITEQSLVTIASGLASLGFRPFAASYAAFSPGRNWEQIRTTIALNNQPVVVVGAHAGLSVGPDGATHQVLEDLALMNSLPNMQIFVPADYQQAIAITNFLATDRHPSYLRLSREPSPNLNLPNFIPYQAQIISQGGDLLLISYGPILVEVLQARKILSEYHNIHSTVINLPTIKPLDVKSIIFHAAKIKRIVVVEEHQQIGGIGSQIGCILAEGLSPLHNFLFKRIAIKDRFGQSGEVQELYSEYEIDASGIVKQVINLF